MLIDIFSKKNFSIILVLFILVLFSGCMGFWSGYIDFNKVRCGMFDLATSLAVLMISIHGMRWILSTQPEEREDAKKGIFYIIWALLIAAGAVSLVNALYCANCNCCTTLPAC